MKCPICQCETGIAANTFCAQHAMFAFLWSAVRAGKWSDWPDGAFFSHATMQTTDNLRLRSLPSWRDTVQRINDRASWWLPGNQSHESGDAA